MKYIALLFLSPLLAFASGPDIEQEVATNVATSVTGSTTKAFSVGGGDMDINQCLATHSVLFGLWQGTHLNVMCVADGLDARGEHREAAEMRCSVRRFRKVYGDNCVEDTMFKSTPPPPAVPTSGPLEEVIIVQQAALEEHEEEYESLENRLARIERGNRIASQKAQARRDYAKQTIERLENDSEE